MFIVTGGAGFIGANIVAALNERGTKDVIVVDDLTSADKFRNLVDCEIADYLDKDDFFRMMQGGAAPKRIKAIFHQGACSDTTENDGACMMRNNFEYSKVAQEDGAHRRPALFQRLRRPRAAQGPHGLGRVPSFCAVPR